MLCPVAEQEWRDELRFVFNSMLDDDEDGWAMQSDGSYLKIWNGREDNEHLVDILSALDADDPDYRELVYAELARRYPRPSGGA